MATTQTALQAVQQRIRTACTAFGREASAVRLLAVSKTVSGDRIRQLAAQGQTAFGENYVQEALDKQQALTGSDLEWHFIGPIQSNKTRQIAQYFSWVHSVERLKIAERLSAQRPADLPPLKVLLQVNVSGEDSKSGCAPAQLAELATGVAQLPRLQLAGLMAIPEPTSDVAQQRRRFAQLRQLAEGLCLAELSMGMSADLEAAVAEGATWVRVGSALFGSRPLSDLGA